ncbi:MAG: tRNA (guanosine(46)-N7)-methyltransferase TrmB [Prochloraceae cyanobacterium]|nr:tRNA (guanosine(46)-N7)-methyltransferase TrmB [Prochloraceae cyanobacterium]
MVKLRIRQHVNPLARKYQTSPNTPDWNLVYLNSQRPLHLDIGCARGEFLLEMAKLILDVNFLGVEIRSPLVVNANLERDRSGLTHLHYLYGNINSSIETILKSLPAQVLQYVTIQFPDPWFKNKHRKRRVVRSELVDTLAKYLVPGGIVFIQSDVEFLATQIHHCFSSHPSFQLTHKNTWLGTNPLPVSTEREIYSMVRNKTIYRAVFAKKIS